MARVPAEEFEIREWRLVPAIIPRPFEAWGDKTPQNR
jgi:hypothetical protein